LGRNRLLFSLMREQLLLEIFYLLKILLKLSIMVKK